MDFQGLQIQNYVYHFLKEISSDYSFVGKNVLFLFPNSDINNARALLKLGAKQVYFCSYDFEYEKLPEENIFLFNVENLEQLSNIEDDSVDMVVGLEILEHLLDMRGFFSEFKRILKKGGVALLHGYPLWTSPFGHNLWVENKFYFNNESYNPLKPWEHLTLENVEEVKKAVEKNGYSVEDGDFVADWIFGGVEINRLSPREIFECATDTTFGNEKYGHKSNRNNAFDIYQTEQFSYFMKKSFSNQATNSYFDKALSKYSEEDLLSEECLLTMTKNINTSDFLKDKNLCEFPELPYFRRVVFEQFFKKYNLLGANVLNLSFYDNNFFSKILKKHGAKSVTGVSPRLVFENVEKIDGIDNYYGNFEDFSVDEQKFDIIFGFDIIPNIRNFNKFCNKLRQYSNLSTGVHLDGYMPYTSACGHVACSENHKFYDETNPVDYWEHLFIKDEEDLKLSLGRHGVAEEEFESLVSEFFGENSVLRMSPSEIEEKISQMFPFDVRRIYKYYPKNEYYNRALEKYSEDDLNVERLIITSDVAHLLWLDDLNMDKHYELNVSDINLKYRLPKKRVLSISPNYCNSSVSDGLLSLRAEEVVSLGAYYSGYELQCGKNAKLVNQPFEDVSELNGKFDVIYGVEILEHIKDMRKFIENLKNIVADRGVICLQGRPLWTSDDGHNYPWYVETGELLTGEENGKISPWQHLAFENKNDFKKSLLSKQFSEKDAENIAEYVFNSDQVNRLSYAKILDILNEFEDISYGTKKVLDYSEENEFYEIASKKYTHEELRTKELNLAIRKKP